MEGFGSWIAFTGFLKRLTGTTHAEAEERMTLHEGWNCSVQLIRPQGPPPSLTVVIRAARPMRRKCVRYLRRRPCRERGDLRMCKALSKFTANLEGAMWSNSMKP